MNVYDCKHPYAHVPAPQTYHHSDLLLTFLFLQALILKLKDPDPNPGVVISVLATIGELAQVQLDTIFKQYTLHN